MNVRLVDLYCYPLKSARAVAHRRALLTARGLQSDRDWLLIDENDRFLTQRELPRLALLEATVDGEALTISAPGLAPLHAVADGGLRLVRIWRDQCAALDAGELAAARLSEWLGRPCRLVKFAAGQRRLSAREWSGDIAAENAFSDGFPLLLLNLASLADLNARLRRELPVARFRPNLVVDGLPAYAEDRLAELRCGPVVLRAVKPCTRCVITTTDQERGVRDGEEPLRTLRGYRHDRTLQGVTFCQNLVIVAGAGAELATGSEWQASWRQ